MLEISIIIPAYNASRFLAETVESVLDQTFGGWELVIVDDGSTDDTPAIAEGFAARDGRIRVVRQENGGLPAARNFGYAAASRDVPYVIFLDADDVWETDALSLLYDHIQDNPSCAAVNGLGRFMDEHGEPFPAPERQRWGVNRSVIVGRDIQPLAATAPARFETVILENCILTPGVALIRRSALDAVGLFDDTRLSGQQLASEDWDLWLRLSARWDILLLPTIVLNYRQHAGNMSGQLKTMRMKELYIRHKMCHLMSLTPNQRRTAMWVYQRAVTADVMEEARRYRRASYQEARIAWQSLTGGQGRLSATHWTKFLQLYLKYRQGRAKFHACDLPQPLPVLFGIERKTHEAPHAAGGGRRAKGDLPVLQFLSQVALTDPSPRYRCYHLREQWRLRGGEATIKFLEETGPLTLLGDVLILHRASYDETTKRIVKAARSAGKILIYSTDDLTIHSDMALKGAGHLDRAWLHDSSAADQAARWWQMLRDEADSHRRLLDQCQGAIVTTEYLAGRVRAAGKSVHVLRNALSVRQLALSRQARETAVCRPSSLGRLMLGYLSGSATHDHDFGDIAPVVAEVMSRYRHVYLTLVGSVQVPDCLRGFGCRVRRLPFLPWPDLPAVIATLDVNLAPLDVFQPFNHAKSEIKWIEAGAVGVPTLASASCGNREAITHGEDGLLAGTLEDWEENLCALIDQPELRQRLGEAAYRAVSARHTPEARSRELSAVIQDIYRHREASGPQPAPAPPPVVMRPISR